VTSTAHLDTFARDNLPPLELWPDLLLSAGSPFDYPERLNAAVELLDRQIEAGHGGRPLIHLSSGGAWTYEEFRRQADRIAHVLVNDMGLVPGNRVLLHAPNTPLMAAAWFGVLRAGGIAVATMPLLRAVELTYTIEKARISHALCHSSCRAELDRTRAGTDELRAVMHFGEDGELEAAMATKADHFEPVDTAADDVALIAFTSGTTGKAKATMHFHRDVMAICDAFPASCQDIRPDDVFTGSPPLAFTFGLGGILLFPMRFGASTVFPSRPGPDGLLEAIQQHRVTTCYTSPTAYRAMLGKVTDFDLSSLRECVSAGEPLPAPTSDAWFDATGLRIIDGIGSTEMLHIFISAPVEEQRPGTTGKPIPGYEARVVDREGNDVTAGTVGLLAVRGPTGCRYLADTERQREYVRDGWNYPGDAYLVDEDGYYHYQARTDDLIVSGGYNIAGLEIESVLLRHPAVAECGVVGVPDPDRGQIVKAFVVTREGHDAGADLARALQDFVKQEIAPYKYPRAVSFLDSLPRTQTGKLQRFRLRELE
jgi:2-aminobenzoate-CoA ligase